MIVISIPAYNEEKTLPKVILGIHRAMQGRKYQILVVDDGSRDKTKEVGESCGAIVYSNTRNLGLARTFEVEMELCRQLKADIIVHTDADGQYPSRYIPNMIDAVEKGADLVLGSRFLDSSPPLPFLKRLGNMAFAKVFSHITKLSLTDTTTGFRAFRQEISELPLISNFTYTQEQLLRAAKAGYKIVEIPIKARKTRDSRLFGNPLEYAAKAWLTIFRIYRDYDPLKFFGMIGSLLISFGSIIGTYFVWLHLTVGIKGHLGLMMLMFLLLMVGLQVVLFGFLADMIRK
jgi:glycosyltransferase involved in cell wall biosynthesis